MLGVELCCVTDLLLSWQRSSSIRFQGAVPGHSSPREMWATTGMWQEEEGMVIVDADLSLFMYLLSIFFLDFSISVW